MPGAKNIGNFIIINSIKNPKQILKMWKKNNKIKNGKIKHITYSDHSTILIDLCKNKKESINR